MSVSTEAIRKAVLELWASLTSSIEGTPFQGLLKWLRSTKTGRVCSLFLGYFLLRKPLTVAWRKLKGYPPGTIGTIPMFSTLLFMKNLDVPACVAMREQYGPVSMIYAGFERSVLINDYRIAESLFARKGFAVRGVDGLTDGKITTAGYEDYVDFGRLDGMPWRKRRQITHHAMVDKLKAKDLDRIIGDYFRASIIPSIQVGKPWNDMRELLTAGGFNSVFRATFGHEFEVDGDEYSDFIRKVKRIATIMNLLVALLCLPKPIQRSLQYFRTQEIKTEGLSWQKIAKWLREFKQQADSGTISSADDLYASALLQQIEDGNMLEGAASADIAVILLAGTHTTATAVEQALFHGVRNPKDGARLSQTLREVFASEEEIALEKCKKIGFLQAFIRETLRLSEQALLSLQRHMTEDQTVQLEDGTVYTLPAGSSLFFNLAAASHEEEIFGAEPEKFKPDRWLDSAGKLRSDLKLTTFGFGRRNCVGRRIADAQLLLFTAHFFFRYRFESETGKPEDTPLIGFQGYNVVEQVQTFVVHTL